MGLAHAIGEHLPYLRRYARALCGTQKSGDAYVRACLEAVVADIGALSATLSPRVALYKLFHAIWNTTDVDAAAPTREGPGQSQDQKPTVEQRLRHLTPTSRQALLLTAMEGFSQRETAQILNKKEGEIGAMLQSALEEITRQPNTRVLVIEDEPIISLDLQSIVREMGHTVVAVATTRDEAVSAADKTSPGLVLADIKLADGSSGIDAVRQIMQQHNVPVVFITAYPERLLTGERPEPTFLVTKPFIPETVRVAVSQALLFT